MVKFDLVAESICFGLDMWKELIIMTIIEYIIGGVLLVLALPHRVKAINIGDNYIHISTHYAMIHRPLSLQI